MKMRQSPWITPSLAAFVVLTFLCGADSAPAQPPRRPNVLLILSDDQGTLDLNIYGSTDLQTPNLDALARSGTRFTQFYVAAPVCSPSRAALLTGRVPQRAGVPGNVGITARGMPPEQITIAEMLKPLGYRTGIIGKWHLGYVIKDGPLDQGFDSFFGFKRGCIDNYSHFFYWNGPNVHDLWRDSHEVYEEGTHFSDLMVRETKEFLANSARNKSQPFFLYLPFNIPHYPLQGKAKWRNYYKDLPSPRKHYAAMVSTLDEQVGAVLATLDQLGLRENTLIFFLSDHGHSTEERAMFGGGNAGPYRGAKFSLLEAGIRVPAMISLPGVVPKNEVRGQMVVSVDILPTIAELTGAELPGYKIDGVSMMPLVRSASAPSRHKVFHWQQRKQWAVREGDWKLVVNGLDTDRSPLEGADKIFLSDLSKDVTERVNIAGAHPDVVKRLTKLHQEFVADVGASN